MIPHGGVHVKLSLGSRAWTVSSTWGWRLFREFLLFVESKGFCFCVRQIDGDWHDDSAIQEGSRESIYGVVGLANLRNTCYFNSVLQVLVSSHQLQKYYGGSGHKMESECGSLALGMRDIFSACKGEPIDPSARICVGYEMVHCLGTQVHVRRQHMDVFVRFMTWLRRISEKSS